MKIAICDDSSNDIVHLKKICDNDENAAQAHISVFHNSTELIRLYQTSPMHLFDLIFLDVDMPEANGIQVGQIIRNSDPDAIIVFVTSYSQYAINAYECHPFHYILKPCQQQQVQDILRKVHEKYIMSHQHHIIQTRERILRVPLKDIHYVEYCRRHVVYHLNGREIETNSKLKDVLSILQPFGFYQIHQGYIVNLEMISEIRDYDVILSTGEKVPISVRKKSEVVLAFSNYVQRCSV